MPANPRVRTNNAQGTITDNPLVIGATTMNSAGLANLAAVATQHAVIILDPLRVAGAPEIVVVTAHTASATSATITRGAYGSTARQHASGTAWVHAPITEDFIQILTSATRPSDPYRGQLIFETDTNSFVGRDTSDAWQTAVPLGVWTSYTPTLTQSATVTKNVSYARYQRVGRIINVTGKLVVTGAGTAANQVLVGLPVAAADTNGVVGVAAILDSNVPTRYVLTALGSSTTTVFFVHDTGGTNAFGIGPAVTLAVNDEILYSITYEAAS